MARKRQLSMNQYQLEASTDFWSIEVTIVVLNLNLTLNIKWKKNNNDGILSVTALELYAIFGRVVCLFRCNNYVRVCVLSIDVTTCFVNTEL